MFTLMGALSTPERTVSNSRELAFGGLTEKIAASVSEKMNSPLSEAELDLAYASAKDDGIELSVAVTGKGGSSTRAEIAAGIIAMAADREIHMGTDSKAFCSYSKYGSRSHDCSGTRRGGAAVGADAA